MTRRSHVDHGGVSRLVVRLVGLLLVSVVVLVLAPAVASAEPLCTDTWTGPAEGTWQTAADWSEGSVPTSSSVACIGSGKTVSITNEATNQTGALAGEGALVIGKRTTLEITSSLETSTIKSLTMDENAHLTGAGTLDITGSFSAEEGAHLEGTGTTVLKSAATGSLVKGAYVTLVKRTLINEGSLTAPAETAIVGKEGAAIVNHGTLTVNGEGETYGLLVEEPGPAMVLTNTGTLQKTAGSGGTRIYFQIDNEGSITTTSGQLAFYGGGTSGTEKTGSWTASGAGTEIEFLSGGYTLGSTVSMSGAVKVENSVTEVTADKLEGSAASLTLKRSGKLVVNGPGVSTVDNLTVESPQSGSGELDVTGTFLGGESGSLGGSGSTVIKSGGSGSIVKGVYFPIQKRTLTNEGSLTVPPEAVIIGKEGAAILNRGTLTVNSEGPYDGLFNEEPLPTPSLTNTGTLRKTEGTGTTYIYFIFENLGLIEAQTGKFAYANPVTAAKSTHYGGAENPSTPGHPQAKCGDPVSCATGNFSETETDLAVGGRGVGLDLTRTYNSQAAAEGVHGPFGYGWSSSFSDHLVLEPSKKLATLVQAEGSTVPFVEAGGSSFTSPAWTQDTLSGTAETGYTLTLANQTKYKFAGASGRLESVTDRDGNATTLSYTAEGRLEAITDPSGRKITLAYNGEGLVESAKDPMGHTVKYTYEGGNLKSVTQPAEESLRWQYKYDESHQMTELRDGREGKTTNEYNSSHQVTSQTDPAGHTLTFEYTPFQTKVTNTNTGAVTLEVFTSNDEPASITHGYGTASATTESFLYNEGGYVTSETNGDGHTTTYGYDSAGDRTSMVDPDKDETKWTYDSTHDVETMTTPNGETTTIKREAHGNPETIERPAPESKTQITKYKYGTHGELESVEDPLKRVWKYEYDSKGDRTAEIDPLSNKRTWEYNEDSQETATISPRGNASGKPAEYTTKIERDAQGRPLTITDPLSHTTKYKYDGDGNISTVTDGNSHTTTYTYNGDNEPTKVEAPNKAITETEYDGAGQVVKQIDGNKHATEYKRNILEQVTEVIDPLKHKTLKEYDAAGNLIKVTDPKERTTTYTYDPANRLTEVVYSSGTPSTVKYEYDKDGDRTKMTDGTGTTKYTYDQLDRLTESENGHKEVVKYEYDLANEQTKITYPNTKAVTRTFDKDGRLETVSDWNKKETKFSYNQDSEPSLTTFPSETKDKDEYIYNDADQMTEVKMLKSTESLASLVYTRDSDGQVKKTTAKKLPGTEVNEATYDENNRLTKYGTTEYKYDPANNPTKEGSSTNTYNEADQLEKGTGVSYTYDTLGERTKTTPEKGPATTYGYDQAGDLTTVERPKEGETAEIKDSYVYNGEGLRTSQTISGTTGYIAWDMTEELPLILSDGTNSYIYGPSGLPIEQINNSTGTTYYLHHDQGGSTRALTGSGGTVEGKCSYGAYGSPTCEGGATTPLGYDAQYTSADTGLIYLRARVYDPATAQFMSVDALTVLTGAPYTFGAETPLNLGDPTGLLFGIPGTPSSSEILEGGEEAISQGATRTVGFIDGLTKPIFGGTAALGLGELVDECSSEYQVAESIGGYTFDAEAGATALYAAIYGAGEAGYAAATRTDLGNTLFGRIFEGVGTGPEGSEALTGTLNSGPVRLGLGWRGDTTTGENIFRLGVGNSHFDFLH